MGNNIIVFTKRMKPHKATVCNVFISDEYWWATRCESDRLAPIPFTIMWNEARFNMWPGQDNGHSVDLAPYVAMLCDNAPLCSYISDKPLKG